jgi:hypothetical protein
MAIDSSQQHILTINHKVYYKFIDLLSKSIN